ncbi:MAG: peptidyl-prolyl cis-trans isomerase [Pseudomonadota bacterium]
MLQKLRDIAAGTVAKVLFALLVGSFALWGIGDYAFLRPGDPTALRVGAVNVTGTQLGIEYRRELDRLRRAFGQLDAEMARQIGVMDQVIERLIDRTVLDQAADKLGLLVSDEVVRNRITADPSFKGPGGTFDRYRFQQLLWGTGYNEQGFTELLRREITRAKIVDAIAEGIRVPDLVVDRLYRYRNERRDGEAVFVPTAAVGDVGQPDDAQLQAVFDDNVERFTAPEYRALSVVRVGVEEIMPSIRVDEQALREEYEARLSEMKVPEHREVEQMVFQDEAAAKAAHERLEAGAAFSEVAREAADQAPEQLRLGLLKRDDLVPELAEPVFALAVGANTPPVKSPFGWHLFRVAKIEPAREPALADVRDRLMTDVRRRLAADSAYETATKLEDAIAGGAALEAAAEKVGLSLIKIEALDPRGGAPDGTPVPALADAREALAAAFSTEQGRESQLIETRDGVWFLLRVDRVTSSRVKPLAEVRAQAIELWEEQKRHEAARTRAETILDRVRKGEIMNAASSEFGLRPEPTPALVRPSASDRSDAAAPEVTARLFQLKPLEAGLAPARNGYYVVRLVGILPADPGTDRAGVSRLRDQLRSQIGNDLVSEYSAALRQRFGVEINRETVDRLY